MRRFYLILMGLWYLTSGSVLAAEMEASVRLERSKSTASPLPILVVVRPALNTLENSLVISVNGGWSVAGSVAVSTTGLPTGITPLPALSTGSGVGSSINFTIGDLTTGERYGFYITGGLGQNPNLGDYKWKIDLGSESREVNLAVISNDQVTVTGRVGALASDFALDFSVDENLGYTINYGTYLNSVVKPLVLTATWDRGTIEGNSMPTVDVVDYVDGSAVNAYGDSVPIVDTVNRKIAWTIASFPANMTNQSVSFKLKARDWRENKKVSFKTQVVLEGAKVVTTTKQINSTLAAYIEPTQPITTGSSNSPTPSVGQLTPTKTVTNLEKIEKVEVVEVGTDSVVIMVERTGLENNLEVVYGTNPANLDKKIINLDKRKKEKLAINGLSKNKIYYFQVVLNGQRSDVYTFQTGSEEINEIVVPKSIVLTAENAIVSEDQNDKNEQLVRVLNSTKYAVSGVLVDPINVKRVQIIVERDDVLGISSENEYVPNVWTADMGEISSGKYVGHLLSPEESGMYAIYLKVYYKSGNLVTQKIGQIQVINPLKIIDNFGKNVESALATIYKFDIETNIYEKLTADFIGKSNPVFTDRYGNIALLLPKGKYRVEVESPGYKSNVVDFEISEKEWLYPQIVLEREKMPMIVLGGYLKTTGQELTSELGELVDVVVDSVRFFNLISIFILMVGSVILGAYVAFLLNVYWWQVPYKILWELKELVVGGEVKKIKGNILNDKYKKPVNRAKVILIDDKSNKIIDTCLTNSLGNFEFPEAKDVEKVKLMVVKNGYESSPMYDFIQKNLLTWEVLLTIEPNKSWWKSTVSKLWLIINDLINYLMVAMMLLIEWLLIEYVRKLGLKIIFPWMLILSTSLILWIKMMHEKD